MAQFTELPLTCRVVSLEVYMWLHALGYSQHLLGQGGGYAVYGPGVAFYQSTLYIGGHLYPLGISTLLTLVPRCS